MELSKNIKKLLRDTYEVYFSPAFNAWMREPVIEKNRKKFDLGIITKLITGDNILIKGTTYINPGELGYEGNVCICGCDRCGELYKIYHNKTHTCFLVGSKCVERAGHESFISDINCAKTNGRCKKCNVPLRIKGKRKNTKKIYDGICDYCRKKKNIFLNIEYEYKDLYKSQYSLKWDNHFKSWYWFGYEDELPAILKPLKYNKK